MSYTARKPNNFMSTPHVHTPQSSAEAPDGRVSSGPSFGEMLRISEEAAREAVPFCEEERAGLIDQLKGAVFKVECLRAENEKLRTELKAEREANEVGRVVDAMTPEQVEAYIVKMGGDITEVRARGQKLRAKIAAQMEGDGPVSNATARAYLAAYPSAAGFCPESMEDALRWGHRMYAALRAVIENEEKKSTADGWLLITARAALSSPNVKAQTRST